MIARVSIALLCLTAALSLTTSATANASTNWLPIFEHEAVAYWGHGSPPACGPVRYQWVDDATMRADHTDIGYTPNADAGADCLIRFGVNAWHHMSTPLKCLTVAHEIGHLYGRAHNDRPDSVMYEGGIELIEPEWWLVPACRASMRRVKVRSPRGFVWWAMRARS